jgi:hypothetical protein
VKHLQSVWLNPWSTRRLFQNPIQERKTAKEYLLLLSAMKLEMNQRTVMVCCFTGTRTVQRRRALSGRTVKHVMSGCFHVEMPERAS